jgi:hypothetical protein
MLNLRRYNILHLWCFGRKRALFGIFRHAKANKWFIVKMGGMFMVVDTISVEIMVEVGRV